MEFGSKIYGVHGTLQLFFALQKWAWLFVCHHVLFHQEQVVHEGTLNDSAPLADTMA